MSAHSPPAVITDRSAAAERDWSRALRAWLLDAYQFTRFSVMGCTIIFPILGAATVAERVSVGQSLTLAVAAIAFHVFAYVLNDVIDLPIDRTEPLRAADPLVRGTISTRTALAIALVQLPLLYALTGWMGGTFRTYASITLGVAGMTLYDVYGKRMRLPFVTDVVQGFAWACLVAYGASFSATGFTRATFALMAAVVVYIVMINGVHGALRDLSNDTNAGARTTAMMLGARHRGAVELIIPRPLQIYAATLQLTLIGVCVALLWICQTTYDATARAAATIALMAVAIASLSSLVIAARRARDKWGMVTVGMFHLFISFATLIVPLAPNMSAPVLAMVLVAYVLPVAVMLARFGVRWG